MPYEIPQAVRPIIEKLAELVLPIQDWLKQPNKLPPRYDQFITPLKGRHSSDEPGERAAAQCFLER
jgi:hypothetical protein